MRDVFANQLAKVGDELVAMAEKVNAAMQQSAEALLEPDLAAAQAVIEADQEINRMQAELDEESVRLLTLQAPVATDMRVLVSALRMSASLERMGDLAGHVAKLVRLRFPEPVVPDALRGDVALMAETAQRLALKATKLVETRDLSLKAVIEAEDDTLDALHRKMFVNLRDLGSELSNETVVDMTLLSRYLERFGDHAVKLAYRVEFVVTGIDERPQITSATHTSV